MKKKTINWHGHTYYLLGRDKDGINYWLEKESWDCGWYWGFGYVETFTNNRQPTRSFDLQSHQHWSGLFMKQNKCYRDAFKDFFVETPFTDDEIWELTDYFKTAYTLKSVAELFKHGYSWQTSKAKIDDLASEEQAGLVNEKWLPEVFRRIENILK